MGSCCPKRGPAGGTGGSLLAAAVLGGAFRRSMVNRMATAMVSPWPNDGTFCRRDAISALSLRSRRHGFRTDGSRGSSGSVLRPRWIDG